MATTFKTCSVDGCNGNADVSARGSKGYCCKHYARLQRHGSPLAGRNRVTPGGPCIVVGCKSDASRKGYCPKHYLRLWRHGDPLSCVVTHGMSGTRLHHIWTGMLQRCGHWRGSNAQGLKRYRDRGIRVCPAWQEFPAFSEWALSHGYADDLSIRSDRLRRQLRT